MIIIGKKDPIQTQLLELAGYLGVEDSFEALQLLAQRGLKKEIELLKDEEMDVADFNNVTPLFKRTK
ncbi:hypothetical protein J0L31_11420 [Terrisporobacter glycolicus]|nr:hypothetical protein [Terrisporobacter glycolicus]